MKIRRIELRQFGKARPIDDFDQSTLKIDRSDIRSQEHTRPSTVINKRENNLKKMFEKVQMIFETKTSILIFQNRAIEPTPLLQ